MDRIPCTDEHPEHPGDVCLLDQAHHRGYHVGKHGSWEIPGVKQAVQQQIEASKPKRRRKDQHRDATAGIAKFLMSAEGFNPESHARSSDPATSLKAARELSDQTSMLYRLLMAFGHAPSTAEEASTSAGFSAADGAWKRCSDLKNLGLIQDTGMTRKASSGRDQMVCEITPAGVTSLS